MIKNVKGSLKVKLELRSKHLENNLIE